MSCCKRNIDMNNCPPIDHGSLTTAHTAVRQEKTSSRTHFRKGRSSARARRMHSKATQKQKTRKQSFTSQNANEASGCACIPHSLNAYTTCGGRPNEEANPCPQWLQPACALRYPNPHATSLRGRRMSPRGAAPPLASARSSTTVACPACATHRLLR